MEFGNGSSEDHQSRVLAELVRMLELARQMEAESSQHLKSEQGCNLVLQELLATIEKSIYLAKSSNLAPPLVDGGGCGGGSPRSSGESFPGDASKLAFKDRMPKKRKMLPKRTKEVRVDSSAGGIEFPIDDGHSWRKYGQKDILGAKHPRGYYRCTHRTTQSCPATKQVQRSDKDPLLFQVVYHGEHTCLQGQGQQKAQASSARLAQEQQQQQEIKLQEQDLLLSFQTELRVKTEELELGAQAQTTTLSFSSASPSTPDAINGPSPTFVSPTESESTYLSLCSPESGAAAIGADLDLATTTASTSSDYLDMDFMMEFEQDFSSLFFP